MLERGNRRCILVQLPEPILGAKGGKLSTIAQLAEERLRSAAKRICPERLAVDLGFRVFKLASSNIRAWEPNRDDMATTLDQAVENLRGDRTEQDILFELLLKLGLDLSSTIDTRTIGGHDVHNIGAATLIVCLSKEISFDHVEALALGIVAWHDEFDPAGETTVVFRDSAFADDVAKTNMTAILEQHGIENIRSL